MKKTCFANNGTSAGVLSSSHPHLQQETNMLAFSCPKLVALLNLLWNSVMKISSISLLDENWGQEVNQAGLFDRHIKMMMTMMVIMNLFRKVHRKMPAVLKMKACIVNATQHIKHQRALTAVPSKISNSTANQLVFHSLFDFNMEQTYSAKVISLQLSAHIVHTNYICAELSAPSSLLNKKKYRIFYIALARNAIPEQWFNFYWQILLLPSFPLS